MVDYLQQAMKQPDIDLIRSMKQQMVPSLECRNVLLERLAAEPISQKKEKNRMKQWKSLALAACAALALCIYPAYNARKPAPSLHSYIFTDGSTSTITNFQESAAMGVDKGGEEDINTGDLPGGAYVGDVPVQPGADAYQLLMDHFGETLPDWYGGAYLTEKGTLMILLVNDKDSGDKTLELKVLDIVGKTAPVGFTGAKYSRNELNRMNEELLELLGGKGLPAMWGIYDDQNRIVLEVSEPLSDDLLAALAKIDPEDDAILVCVADGSTVVTDFVETPASIGEPAPGGTTEAPPYSGSTDKEGEEPALYNAIPGVITAPDEDLEAIEPYYDGGITDLPQKKQPAQETAQSVSHDLLPSE